MQLSGFTTINGQAIDDTKQWGDGTLHTAVSCNLVSGIIDQNIQFQRQIITLESTRSYKKGELISASGYLSSRSYKSKGSTTPSFSLALTELEELK